MSVYVGSFEKAFRDAFSETLAELEAEPFEDQVKKIADKLGEVVLDRVHDDIRDRLISSVGDSICEKASEVAARMLENALAGDDRTLRKLFGFYTYPTAYQFSAWGTRPQRWSLIEALMARSPEFFQNERIGQLEGEVAEYKRIAEAARKARDAADEERQRSSVALNDTLNAKERAMEVLFERLKAAGIDYSDLIP